MSSGIAIAAIIRMIATTIKSSISEKPFLGRFTELVSHTPYHNTNESITKAPT
jgi:hypothetical protein